MRKYEVGIVISPDLEEEALTEFVGKINQWITDGDGQVLKMDHWGRRKLAYQINKFREGYYVFVTAEMAPGAIKTLENNFNISESVLRYLTIRVDE